MKKNVHIGTSGWSYAHWGNFYEDLPAKKWLSHYATYFSTVEINSSFYHLPTEKSGKNWYASTPKGFIFSVKASRYITHVKRLNESKESVDQFLQAIEPLKEKLGPILFLLSPSYKLNYGRLEEFVKQLPNGYLYTFEFRNASWFTKEIYALLKKHKIALCISDLGGKLTPIEVTAPFVYVRLHGPQKAYSGRYSSAKLRGWAKRVEEWRAKKLKCYIYFDNDEKGFAVEDAAKLIELIDGKKT